MNKILLVGNGFDLAHGLLTSYNDFLYIMKNWRHFKLEYEENIKEGEFEKYLVNAERFDNQKIRELGNIIETNSWVRYFCNCGAEIDGWIDFEKEIYPVLELFESVFHSNYTLVGCSPNIDKRDFKPNLLRIIGLWDRYVYDANKSKVIVENEFSTIQYGILKKKILKSLKEEFDEFIYAFEIYLHEFVYRNKDFKLLKQIKEINANYVISLNYTLTERLYGISEKNIHHIHGNIREDLMRECNNMVLGVDEQKNQNIDFLYFVKYFQRIQKRTGTAYTSYVNLCLNGVMEEYELHIYGHSLDITDKDILKYTMENACKIYIYYYSQEDFEQKVINLINLYGREIVEENIQSKHFDFIETSDETI